MRILITGVAGMIGSNFAEWLIGNTSHEIIGIDNLLGGYKENIPTAVNFIQADIENEILIPGLFDYFKPDVCYHFAAYAAEGRSNYIRRFNHYNNTVGTANIINSCVNYNCKLIFTSSVAVFSGNPPFHDSTLPRPVDSYGVSKYCSEMDIQIAGNHQGMDWCIVRPRNVYGPKQSLWDTQRNVMGIWMNQILNKEPMTIFGDGSNKRSFTYIEDILEPLYKAFKVSNEIINLGTDDVYTIKEVNEILQDITGYRNIVYLEPREEVKEAYCYISKSVHLLDYKNKVGLPDGIANMWNWAKQQPKREKQIPPSLEVFKTNHSSIK